MHIFVVDYKVFRFVLFLVVRVARDGAREVEAEGGGVERAGKGGAAGEADVAAEDLGGRGRGGHYLLTINFFNFLAISIYYVHFAT